MYISIHICLPITNNEKEAMNFKKIKERVDGRSKKGGESKGEML